VFFVCALGFVAPFKRAARAEKRAKAATVATASAPDSTSNGNHL
jgi:hypothetical protein